MAMGREIFSFSNHRPIELFRTGERVAVHLRSAVRGRHTTIAWCPPADLELRRTGLPAGGEWIRTSGSAMRSDRQQRGPGRAASFGGGGGSLNDRLTTPIDLVGRQLLG
jgi:hypothetical protein